MKQLREFAVTIAESCKGNSLLSVLVVFIIYLIMFSCLSIIKRIILGDAIGEVMEVLFALMFFVMSYLVVKSCAEINKK